MTNWEEGNNLVTNCPLNAGSWIHHNMTFPTAGTFWYHSHAGASRAEGSFGAIIVSPSTPNIPDNETFDDTFTIIINDNYHDSEANITAGLMQDGAFTWPGNGQAILINGKGLAQGCYTTKNLTVNTIVYPDGTSSTTNLFCQGSLEEFYVEQDKIYLVHIVNAASLGYYNLAIAGHTMTVVGVDNSTVEQLKRQVLTSIAVGELEYFCTRKRLP